MKGQIIKSGKILKEILENYFVGFKDTKKKVAWCTSVGPAELLRSFGFEVYFPENHGAILGATRKAGDFIPHSIKAGYAGDVCSYTTSDIGAFLCNQTPLNRHGLEKVPKPDLLVYCTNQCREVQDWFSFYAKEFKCPIYGIHPARHIDEVQNSMVEQMVSELKGLVNICEQVTGNKYNPDAFCQTVKLSKDATHYWQKCLQTAKYSPTPWTFFDGCIHMAPIVVLRGTEIALNYYKTLLTELETITGEMKNTSTVENSRFYWDGMPIWGKLRLFADLFEEYKAPVVASTYCNSWIFDSFDENKPFESTALGYLKIFINRSEKYKMEYLKQMISDYRIDGVIFHDAKTCFNNSNTRFGLPQRLKQETGIPVIVIEGDLCDLRFFSEGQTLTRLETFMEQIESSKVVHK